jgi:hypothetical protein
VTTKRQIIDDAYTAVGLASYVFDLTAEELQHAKRTLDGMMAEWGVRGVRIGWNAGGAVSDESGLPDWAVQAASLNLGLRLAGAAGKVVQPETRAAARAAYNAVLVMSAERVEMALDRRQVPAGAGNRRVYGYRGVYLDPPAPQVNTGQDGPLDLG